MRHLNQQHPQYGNKNNKNDIAAAETCNNNRQRKGTPMIISMDTSVDWRARNAMTDVLAKGVTLSG